MEASKINPVALGITLGALIGVSIFTLGILIHLFLAGIPIALAVGGLYITYNPSYLGSFICGGFGLIGGAIAGYIFSRLYNILIDVV